MCFFLICISLYSCFNSNKQMQEMRPYTGPIMEAEDVMTTYSDSAQKKVRVFAPLQTELQNGDREFPKGVKVDFFDWRDSVSSTLTCEYAQYIKTSDQYVVKKNVLIHNLREGKKLSTEELIWFPANNKIQTDKFVRIDTPKESVWGTGLTAADDFSSYSLNKVEGSLSLRK
ncbi:MAG: LPS export ABC transporter periplasmic protein LptC [Cytophagaceae bacterium]|nr:LPS export ABC transporter periplasmic protein LptC [Cytophagaceae bacterium]MDW8456169.1 LPS export ABC transporter periplasmic protein LptC [Cytophagaceae bacterium]